MKLRRSCAAGGALVAALLVAGCGSSDHSRSAPVLTTVTTQPAFPPSTTGPEAGTPATPFRVTTTTSTSAQADHCDPASLTITLGSVQGAAGNMAYPFDVADRSAQPCPIGGYFGVSIYDQQGNPVTPSASRNPGSVSHSVVLTPGHDAHFTVLVSLSAPSGNSQTCAVIGSFHLIPPNAKNPVRVTVPASAGYRDCGNASVGPTSAG